MCQAQQAEKELFEAHHCAASAQSTGLLNTVRTLTLAEYCGLQHLLSTIQAVASMRHERQM